MNRKHKKILYGIIIFVVLLLLLFALYVFLKKKCFTCEMSADYYIEVTILEKNKGMLVVDLDGEECHIDLEGVDICSESGKRLSEEALKEGMKIKAAPSGGVLETYPLQLVSNQILVPEEIL